MATRLLTLRHVAGLTTLSRSVVYAQVAESPFPESSRIGIRAVRLVKQAARLHRQSSPRRLRSACRVAGMIRGPHDRQHRKPAVWKGDANLRPQLASGAAPPFAPLPLAPLRGGRGPTLHDRPSGTLIADRAAP